MVQSSPLILGLRASIISMVLLYLGFIGPSHNAVAYLITSPGQNEFWYRGSGKTLRWTSVSTDPVKFSIAITNHDAGTYPTALVKFVAKGISKNLGTYQLPAGAISGLREGTGYRINIMTLEGGAILAQSPLVTISGADSGDGGDDPVAGGDDPVDGGDDPVDGGDDPADGDDDGAVLESLEKKYHATKTHEHHDGQNSGKAHAIVEKEHRHKHLHHHKKLRHHFISKKKFQQAKLHSNMLFKSTSKFDHSRDACSRSKPNPRIAKILRA